MKIRHYVQKKELKSIYYALFSSHLTYGNQIWAQHKNVNTKKIFKLQNKALRITEFADFRSETNLIYKNNKILKLGDQVVFDFLNGKLHQCFDSYFTRVNEIHAIQTISSRLGCLFLPHFSTAHCGINSVTRKCIVKWNFFSRYFNRDLRDLSRHDLKKKISSYFLDRY